MQVPKQKVSMPILRCMGILVKFFLEYQAAGFLAAGSVGETRHDMKSSTIENPQRLTWNSNMRVWKMMLLFKGVTFE